MKTTYLTRKDADWVVGDQVSTEFDSIAWAFEVHVNRADEGIYHAAMLYGNEDCPAKIEFYTQAEPTVNDAPAWTWLSWTEVEA